MNYKNDKMNKIEPLQIGDGKLNPRVENKSWWHGIKSFFIGIKINWW